MVRRTSHLFSQTQRFSQELISNIITNEVEFQSHEGLQLLMDITRLPL